MDRIALNKILIQNGFTPPYYVEGCSQIGIFLPDSMRTGIYILHFSDGTKYVGKSVEISRRFNQHTHNFPDIMAVSFKEIPFNLLDSAEEQTIELLERNNINLRNILLSSFTYKITDFYELVSESEQNCWLADLDYNCYNGSRTNIEELRNKYKNRFMKFMHNPFSDKAISFLRAYIKMAIPFPVRTEINYWVVSCLPAPRLNVLCRLNIYWQEVLTIYEDNGVLNFSFHLMDSELPNRFAEKEFYKYCETYDHKYKPGGSDQLNLVVKSFEKAFEILEYQEVRSSIRKFNLNLMRKGKCQYSRYHCLDLADALLIPY